jgi:hypothetical protein
MLRVHISPVGFEIDRVVLPAIKLKADRVWLLTHNNPNEDEGSQFIRKIKMKLEEEKIECLEESANRKDLFDTLRALRSVILDERGNNIMINVSTGSKIQSIAAMMACMMFKEFGIIKPYYAEPQNYNLDLYKQEQETEGLDKIIPLPDYRIEIPNQTLVKSLELINREKSGTVTKKRLMDLALRDNLIYVDENKQNRDTSAYMALDANILKPLQKWNFITIEKSGKRKLVYLSDDGKNALKFLGS